MDAELQKLKDIHLPPLMPMWAIIVASSIAFLLMLSVIYLWRQNNKKKFTAKFALAQLKRLQLEDPQNINIAAEISLLLRRTALHYFGRKNIAGLSGTEWLNFLNHSGKTTQFTEATGQLLLDAPYRKSNATDLTPLFVLTQAWLNTISKKKKISEEN